MPIDQPTAAPAAALQPPNFTNKDVLAQFWADIYGKEVQSAATYSYMWLADQMGHVCLGIVIDFALTLVMRYVAPWLGIAYSWQNFLGLLLAALAVSLWEVSAYKTSVSQATGLFPLDRKLLRDNAAIAAGYMVLGTAIGFVFHQESELRSVLWFIALVAVGVLFAPPWIRQKMIWQKASLPYLFRLADMGPTIGVEAAQKLQALIDKGAPPDTPPVQVVIGGPISSGRTPIAAGIGTEYAFKKTKVRYLDLSSLLEFAAQPPDPTAKPPKPAYMDDLGPSNLDYWPWSESQVLIIDDVGPLVAATNPDLNGSLAAFRKLLSEGLGSIAPLVRRCHTVWVMGDLQPAGHAIIQGKTLDEYARVVAEFCQAGQDVLVIELADGAKPPPGIGEKFSAMALPKAELRLLRR